MKELKFDEIIGRYRGGLGKRQARQAEIFKIILICQKLKIFITD